MLGKGPPGGAWHRMDPNLRTLSLSAWMSLPGFDFPTWERLNPVVDGDEEVEPKKMSTKDVNTVDMSPLQRRNLSLRNSPSGQQNLKHSGPTTKVQTRALISRVAEYYQNYVKEMGLEKHFWNDVTVTNVFPVRVHGNHRALKAARWMVVGYEKRFIVKRTFL